MATNKKRLIKKMILGPGLKYLSYEKLNYLNRRIEYYFYNQKIKLYINDINTVVSKCSEISNYFAKLLLREKLLINLLKVDYEKARLEYLDYLSFESGVIKVIEFGEIKSPGLSDLDWLIIYDEKVIKSYKALIPNKLTSDNFKEAFQHRPIFLESKYENYVGEFILPTKTFVHKGDHFKEESFSSINNLKRDLTVGFEFFKRQKKWLRKVEFEKLSFKKKNSSFLFQLVDIQKIRSSKK